MEVIFLNFLVDLYLNICSVLVPQRGLLVEIEAKGETLLLLACVFNKSRFFARFLLRQKL